MKLFKIGEIAKSAGITVRTLHHYDQMGILVPSGSRESGHRLYTEGDIERLQQVISLKSMGFPLSKITEVLVNGGPDLREVLAAHNESLEEQIRDLQQVKESINLMLMSLARDETLNTKELLQLMKEVQKMESTYTPEQLEKLKKRYAQYPDKVREVEVAWPKLFEKFKKAMESGLSPSDTKVQILAAKAQEYIDLFTGGDKEIEKNLDKAYSESQENALKNWGVSKEIFEYASKARAYFNNK